MKYIIEWNMNYFLILFSNFYDFRSNCKEKINGSPVFAMKFGVVFITLFCHHVYQPIQLLKLSTLLYTTEEDLILELLSSDYEYR